MNNDSSVKSFSRRYKARIGPTGEKYRTVIHSTPRLNDYTNPLDIHRHYDEQEIISVEMPESMFRHLMELDQMMTVPPDQYRGLMIDHRPISMVLANVRYESRIRNQVPAVKKAWEQYQTLLKLSGSPDPELDSAYSPYRR